MRSTLPEHDRTACRDRFLLPEALRILTQGHSHRDDYHMTFEQWLEVVEDAGLLVADARARGVIPGAPRVITLASKAEATRGSSL